LKEGYTQSILNICFILFNEKIIENKLFSKHNFIINIYNIYSN